MKIDSNYLNSIVTFIVGLFAFVLYFLNKREQLITAATLILNEVRSIENHFDNYSENKDFLRFTPVSISTDSWLQYRHLISPRLDEDQRQEIICFFDDAIAFKQIIAEWQQLHLNSLLSKTNKMQEQLISIAHESKGNAKDYETSKSQITSLIHPDSYWFEPSAFKSRMERVNSMDTKISTSSTGGILKKISRGRFLL